ncbi:MFS transporter [Roseibium sp.]|uniref:MFS transporter n=1 Tax=Roseibium sp. TaxID=1936156 RepID=UPI003BAEC839
MNLVGTSVYRTYKGAPRPARLLLTGICLARLAQLMIWPFVTILLTRNHGASIEEIGLMFTVSALCGMAVAPFGGSWADKIGARQLLLTSVAVNILCLLLMMTATGKEIFFAAIFLSSLVSGAAEPLFRSVLGACAENTAQRSGLYHLRYFGVNLAAAIGPLLGVMFIETGNNAIYIVSCGLYAVLGYCVHAVVPAHRVSEQPESAPSAIRSLLMASSDKAFAALFACNFLLVLVYALTDEPLTFYLVSLDVADITWLIAAFSFANAATVLVVHGLFMQTIATMPENRALTVAMTALAIALLMIAFASAETQALWIAAIVVATIAEIIAMPLFLTVVDRIAPERNRNAYFGAYSLSNVGGAFAPAMMSLALTIVSGAIVFVLAAAACVPIILFGVVALQKLPRRESLAIGKDAQA